MTPDSLVSRAPPVPARGWIRFLAPRVQRARLRVLSLASALVLIPGAAQAVIPGLAPALIAILPQLLFLICLSGLLLFSPRAWWRLIQGVWRRPLHSACVLACGVLLVLAACWIGAALPASRGFDPLPDHVHGYPIGDLLAARAARRDPGPRTAPRPRAVRMPGLDPDALPLAFGKRVLLHRERGTRVSCFDPAAERTAWEFAAGKPLLAPPLGCTRREPTGEASSMVICLLTGGSAGADPVGVARADPVGVARADPVGAPGTTVSGTASPATTEVAILNGTDGSTISRLSLAGSQPHAALIDDRLVVAFEDSIACLSLADPARPAEAWRGPRPAGLLQSLAGDDEGRFFLLLQSGLHAGDLGEGRLAALAAFDRETPQAFAIHWGRIYVLLAGADGSRRLACLDPVLAGSWAWSRPLEASVFPELAVAPFGVVLTSPRAVEVLDLATGRATARLPLEDAPAACPAAVSPHSAYVLLANGDVLRYAPAKERIEWRLGAGSLGVGAGSAGVGAESAGVGAESMGIGAGAPGTTHPPVPAPESAPSAGSAAALVIGGERLLAVRGGLSVVLSEVERDGDAGWGQWRGGAARQGTCDPDRVPISAAMLWTLSLREPGREVVAADARRPLEVIPLEDGWLALDAGGHGSRMHWVDDGGRLLHTFEVDGAAWGPVREGSQLYVALRRGDRDLVACFLPRRLDGSASLELLWKAPAEELASRHPLGASSGSLILCEPSGVRALSSEDGSPRWSSSELRAAGAPALAGGRVFAAGKDRRGNDVLAALESANGALLWMVERSGASWEAPSVLGGSVIAVLRAARGEARIVELDAGDGTVRRETALGESPSSPLLLTGERMVAAGKAATSIISRTGEILGRIESHDGAPPVAGYGLLLVPGARGLRCLDTSTLETVWEAALPGLPDSLACERGLIAGASGGQLFCLGAP